MGLCSSFDVSSDDVCRDSVVASASPSQVVQCLQASRLLLDARIHFHCLGAVDRCLSASLTPMFSPPPPPPSLGLPTRAFARHVDPRGVGATRVVVRVPVAAAHGIVSRVAHVAHRLALAGNRPAQARADGAELVGSALGRGPVRGARDVLRPLVPLRLAALAVLARLSPGGRPRACRRGRGRGRGRRRCRRGWRCESGGEGNTGRGGVRRGGLCGCLRRRDAGGQEGCDGDGTTEVARAGRCAAVHVHGRFMVSCQSMSFGENKII